MRVRIAITPTPVDLATTGRDAAQDFRVNGSRIVQEAPLFRASGVTPIDRKNEKTVVTFTRTRLHSSIAAAEQFILEHADAIPRSGKVEFISDNSAVTRFLEPAAISVVESSYLGVTTVHRYQIVGGQMKTP